MCILCIEIYICICVCTFSHYTKFWYCISSTCVNCTGLGPYCQVTSGEQFNLVLLCGGRSVQMLQLSLQSDYKTLKEMSKVTFCTWRVASHNAGMQRIPSHLIPLWCKLRVFTQWPLCTRLLSWVLTSRPQCCRCYYLEVFRGSLIELTALSLCVNRSHEFLLIVFFLFFLTRSVLHFDLIFAAVILIPLPSGLNSGVSIVFSYDVIWFTYVFSFSPPPIPCYALHRQYVREIIYMLMM